MRASDRSNDRAAWLAISPAVLILILIQGYPILRGIFLGFTETSLLSPATSEFVGLENFDRLIDSRGFARAVVTTFVYAIGSVVGTLIVGMAAALLMNGNFVGRRVVRSIVLIPWATPQVAVALIFVWIFNPDYGVLNYILRSIGFVDEGLLWLSDPDIAMGSILLVTIWKVFPFAALVLLAALQSIPQTLVEAARLDGARGMAIFSEVTLPGIRRTLLVLLLFLSIWSLRRFELIWLLTQGGPARATNTLVVDLYREAFVNSRLGQAAAIGVVGFTLSILVTITYYYVERRSAAKAGEQ